MAIVQEPMDKRRELRGQFFDSEIAPAHEAMTAINTDYMESFSELLSRLNSKDNLIRTIELLKKRRLVMLINRKDREAFAIALADVKKGGHLKQRELVALIEYEKAIFGYLHQASPADARVTWYTAFIDWFEFLVGTGDSPFDCHYASIETSRPPAEIVRDAYAAAIQYDIPEAWKDYSAAYQKLRITLKR
ncbi:MAG TPA: hypothetical protein VHW44_13210 [Pseudonocardiaceae bacterium]|nr:hypothetical protein [Pseudonocardiaceae bacterium]